MSEHAANEVSNARLSFAKSDDGGGFTSARCASSKATIEVCGPTSWRICFAGARR